MKEVNRNVFCKQNGPPFSSLIHRSSPQRHVQNRRKVSLSSELQSEISGFFLECVGVRGEHNNTVYSIQSSLSEA